jgi:hypothetical protein
LEVLSVTFLFTGFIPKKNEKNIFNNPFWVVWTDLIMDVRLLIDGRLLIDDRLLLCCIRLRLLEFLTPKRVRLKLYKTLVLPSYEKNQQLLLDFDALSLNLFLDFSQHTWFLS